MSDLYAVDADVVHLRVRDKKTGEVSTQEVWMPTMQVCPACKGMQRVSPAAQKIDPQCWWCGGAGKVPDALCAECGKPAWFRVSGVIYCGSKKCFEAQGVIAAEEGESRTGIGTIQRWNPHTRVWDVVPYGATMYGCCD